MDTAWSRILNQIKSISTEIYTSINAPADPAEMLLLEKTIGVNLPHAFQDYLSTMNGQKDTEENTRGRNIERPLLGYNPFLSITGIIETWNMMNDLFATETEPVEWAGEDKMKPYIWRRHWIPFTESEGSQY